MCNNFVQIFTLLYIYTKGTIVSGRVFWRMCYNSILYAYAQLVIICKRKYIHMDLFLFVPSFLPFFFPWVIPTFLIMLVSFHEKNILKTNHHF